MICRQLSTGQTPIIVNCPSPKCSPGRASPINGDRRDLTPSSSPYRLGVQQQKQRDTSPTIRLSPGQHQRMTTTFPVTNGDMRYGRSIVLVKFMHFSSASHWRASTCTDIINSNIYDRDLHWSIRIPHRPPRHRRSPPPVRPVIITVPPDLHRPLMQRWCKGVDRTRRAGFSD